MGTYTLHIMSILDNETYFNTIMGGVIKVPPEKRPTGEKARDFLNHSPYPNLDPQLFP